MKRKRIAGGARARERERTFIKLLAAKYPDEEIGCTISFNGEGREACNVD